MSSAALFWRAALAPAKHCVKTKEEAPSARQQGDLGSGEITSRGHIHVLVPRCCSQRSLFEISEPLLALNRGGEVVPGFFAKPSPAEGVWSLTRHVVSWPVFFLGMSPS